MDSIRFTLSDGLISRTFIDRVMQLGDRIFAYTNNRRRFYWHVAGLTIYFCYGVWNSDLRQRLPSQYRDLNDDMIGSNDSDPSDVETSSSAERRKVYAAAAAGGAHDKTSWSVVKQQTVAVIGVGNYF